jgi:hypothetical protein
MDENFQEDRPTHAESVRRPKRDRSLRQVSKNSGKEWPANFGELLEWYSKEVQEVTTAAQTRLQHASEVIDDYRKNKTTFEEATAAMHTYYRTWSDAFPSEELRDQAMDQSSRGRS